MSFLSATKDIFELPKYQFVWHLTEFWHSRAKTTCTQDCESYISFISYLAKKKKSFMCLFYPRLNNQIYISRSVLPLQKVDMHIDQERPCLCVVWIFLHRCFVLQNHLLNDAVWLTAWSLSGHCSYVCTDMFVGCVKPVLHWPFSTMEWHCFAVCDKCVSKNSWKLY